MTITNKNDKRSQKGRSMVEMLGVLSIIGVLSVGGISAYSTAMEKHKANELMAATMQEAVLISAQLATGKTNPTLSGINNSLFASASTVANSDNFKIALNAVDADICTKMKSMLGVSSMVHKISDNCSEMTFHKNLTPKAVTQSGGNSGGIGSEGGETEPADPCADIACGEHGSCSNGACECEDGWTGNLCDEQEIKTCSDNSDCTKVNTFCLMTSETTGTCEALDSGTTVGNFLVHTEPMNYWSAQNWCEAHDMKIPNFASGSATVSCGPFCLDSNSYAINIFNEFLGIKKAYAKPESDLCLNLNTQLINLVSSCWGKNGDFIITFLTSCSAPDQDPSATAPVVCVPK